MYDKAKEYAEKMHKGQVRKYTGEPYIRHPIAVAEMCDKYMRRSGYPDHYIDVVKSAAVLHDVIEDTRATYGDLMGLFGEGVTELVFWMTDASRPEDGNRAVRKTIDRWKIINAPYLAVLIKVCDLIDNAKTVIEHDPDFAKVYMEEKAKIIRQMPWDYSDFGEAYQDASKLVKDYFKGGESK